MAKTARGHAFSFLATPLAYVSSRARDGIRAIPETYTTAPTMPYPYPTAQDQGSNPYLGSDPGCWSQVLNPRSPSGNSNNVCVLKLHTQTSISLQCVHLPSVDSPSFEKRVPMRYVTSVRHTSPHSLTLCSEGRPMVSKQLFKVISKQHGCPLQRDAPPNGSR